MASIAGPIPHDRLLFLLQERLYFSNESMRHKSVQECLCRTLSLASRPHHGRAVCVDVDSAASGSGCWGWPSTGGPTGAVERVTACVSPANGLLPPSGILVSPCPPPGVTVMVKRQVRSCSRQFLAKSHTESATRAV